MNIEQARSLYRLEKYQGQLPERMSSDVYRLRLATIVSRVNRTILHFQERDNGKNFAVGALLYGSYYYGDASLESDIDLRLVVRGQFPRPRNDMEVISHLRNAHSLQIGNDPYFIDIDDQKNLQRDLQDAVFEGQFLTITPYKWVKDVLCR